MDRYVVTHIPQEDLVKKPEEILASRPFLADFSPDQLGWYVAQRYEIDGDVGFTFNHKREPWHAHLPWGPPDFTIYIDCSGADFLICRGLLLEVLDQFCKGAVKLCNLSDDISKEELLKHIPPAEQGRIQ